MFSKNFIKSRLYYSDTFEDLTRYVSDKDRNKIERLVIDQVDRIQHLIRFNNVKVDELDVLIADTAYDYMHNNDFDIMYAEFADNKHLKFWDTFLYEGASKDIVKALTENDGTVEILNNIRYLKKDIKAGDPIYTDGDIQIQIHYEETPSGSIELTEVTASKNGKEIYGWDKVHGKHILGSKNINYTKQRNYKFAGRRYIDGEEVRIERYITKNGNEAVRARNIRTGHFVSLNRGK